MVVYADSNLERLGENGREWWERSVVVTNHFSLPAIALSHHFEQTVTWVGHPTSPLRGTGRLRNRHFLQWSRVRP